MYLRLKKWIDAVTPAIKSQSGWENTFTIDEDDAVDIRFKLRGYGWKPNAGDENLVALEKGSYRIYIRENGLTPWNFVSRVEAERAGTNEVTVYKDTGFSTGLLNSGKYDIKIVADKGGVFTGWGGTVEGIALNGQFWFELQVRATKYKIIGRSDSVTVTEYAGVQLV